MIQIHPKRAFLNSDVVISNKGQESALIEDSITSESFTLLPGEYRASRFPAGAHTISIKWLSGAIEEQSFVVEDALKFGGSERKGTYIFDNNPWAIIVMRDRTYFFNEQTKEQFVEHNLSPDRIEEVSPDYLLFTTGKDCSFFSLYTMAFEKTLSSSECVYCGCGHCVLSSNEGLFLYRLDPQFKGQRLDFVRCDEYVINKEEGVIYAFTKDGAKEFSTIKLVSQPDNEEYEQKTSTEIDGDFICFISWNSLLYTKSNLEHGEPNMLYCKNLSHVGSSSLLYSGEQPISSVNGISIWDASSYDELYKKFWNDRNITGEGRRLTIDVIENSKKNYHIQTIETVTFRDKKAETKITSSLFSQGALLHRDDSKKLSFSHRGIYDYVSCEKYTYFFFNSSYKKIYDEVIFTSFDDPYTKVERFGKNVYTSIEGVQIKCHEDKSQPSYGLFFIKVDDESYIYWLKTNKRYVGDNIETVGGTVIVSGGQSNIPPRFFLENGDIMPVPKSTDDMIAHSATGKAILFEKGGYYSFARYKDKNWAYSDDLVLSIYDTLRVKDAVFCSDGDSFIYQKDNEMVLFDFETGNETVFESNTGIKYNVNGYRPYCTKDYFSRPVIVDPLSHRTIDHNFLGQYRFSNIEGNVYFKERITRRLLIADDSEVSNYQYQTLRNEYDYTLTMDKDAMALTRQKRIKYCQEKLGRKVGIFSAELTMQNFVDLYIVKIIEWVVINRYGRRVEIRIGSPLYFLNYVAFSTDSNRVAICGKYRDASGLCLIYDFIKDEVVHRSTITEEGGVGRTMAIWLGLFSKTGDVAYYDSTPNTYFLREGEEITKIQGRSFLTFSPSGKLMALSKQGYTPYSDDASFWGHEPSCDIYIARTDDPKTCLCHFNDHGSGIVGIGVRRETIASASFSVDDKKILSVSRDGVVVVRNLHLETDTE